MCLFFKSEGIKKLQLVAFIVLVLFLCGCEDDSEDKKDTSSKTENVKVTVDFEELTVPDEGYWNGSDLSGSFVSKDVEFYNDYTEDYSSWTGVVYSNCTDMVTVGYANQYSVYSDSGNNGSSVFAVLYLFGEEPLVSFEDGSYIKGFYVNNTTYVYHALKSGEDGYGLVKKFGGNDGNDKDYLKLVIIGFDDEGVEIGQVEFFLADYRFDDNSKDYIIRDWTWVDLSAFTEPVKELAFELVSTDTGDYGMNTPAYFALDDLVYEIKPE
ncbi:MAG: DUF4465 domain-containing protein [Spirochaetes bacterium]|nr:DUF4465 domain-containing protein [Spirochaetota bacterium]MBN2771497.1 DUF4465 domain-containing protein [Spirochaetota bacterium]